MAQTASRGEAQKLPFWRTILNYLFDVRVLGVLGQLAFTAGEVVGTFLYGEESALNRTKECCPASPNWARRWRTPVNLTTCV